MIQSTNHADNNSVASSQYMKEDICIYIACFLVELYLEFLKFEPKLQVHFMFAHLVRKESYLSFSVFIFSQDVIVYIVSHDLCRILESPWGGISYFEIDYYFLVWGKQIDK